MEPNDTYIRVDVSDGYYTVAAEYWNDLRKAMFQYIDKGVDGIIEMKSDGGSLIVARVSIIQSIMLSTSKARTNTIERELRLKQERKEIMGFEDDE